MSETSPSGRVVTSPPDHCTIRDRPGSVVPATWPRWLIATAFSSVPEGPVSGMDVPSCQIAASPVSSRRPMTWPRSSTSAGLELPRSVIRPSRQRKPWWSSNPPVNCDRPTTSPRGLTALA